MLMCRWKVYYCTAQNSHCALVGQERKQGRVPAWLLAALVSKPSFWLGGLLTGISVLIEAKHRRGELVMYVLPKGLKSAWVAVHRKGVKGLVTCVSHREARKRAGESAIIPYCWGGLRGFTS